MSILAQLVDDEAMSEVSPVELRAMLARVDDQVVYGVEAKSTDLVEA